MSATNDNHPPVLGVCRPDPEADAHVGHHSFRDGDTGQASQGMFEVFWCGHDPASTMEMGWYWWACFPGCLPGGEPDGPYRTSTDAWKAAHAQDS